MQPIKTTNAMNPAPAKGIESFPTPVIDDVVISEIVNAWKGDYQPLEYGTLWKDVSHAPNQGSFPEHKLVYQQPTSEDGQWVKRIWVNDRVNQDSYNYAIKYSAGSQEHPIYIRTYVVPRETYGPIPDLTPDPLFPNAVLVDEEAVRNEGELDSKYITVTRVYETLPGPQIPTKRYNERGDLETVIVQTVAPNTPPDPDGLLVTGSQVVQEEVSKGIKTTSTVQDHSLLQIKEKKEGLLGETITTDDIVDPSTNPDPLSQTVVSSVVEQYTATKARKRTTTASGPTSLSQKSKDGKLLGDITSTESVVAPNASPDAVSSAILSSEVRQVDSGKAIKRNVVLNSTPTLSGNQNEQGLLGNKSTIESIVNAGTFADPLSLSVISSSVEPIDSVRSRKVTVTSSGPSSLSGGQKKEGLLGETNVNESIVPAGASPDSLSQTVVSSVVEPIDSAKSRKVTITATGPNSLQESSKDGKLLGDTTSTESIVAPNTIPDAPSATILSSQVKQLDSGKAVKTNIVLNSTPTLIGGQAGEGLLGTRDTTETIVPSGTIPDEVSLTVISSQVEPIDSVRSRKITIESTGPTSLSGAQKKEGLLGETNIEESIVSAGAQPDALSETIVSSIIEPIDSAKSKKITITSTGPSSLEQRNKDGKLLGDITSVKSVVGPNDLPDNPDASILSSEVNQIDSGKAIKTNVVLNSTPTLSGKQSEQGLLGVKSTVESIVPAGTPEDTLSLSVISSAVEPIDSVRSRKVTTSSSGPTTLSGGQKKEGLLGETLIQESIVPAGSQPDSLTTSVISSEVTAIDSAKSKKVTISSSGPTVLSQKSKDGKLLGDITSTESVVEPSSNPDEVSQTVLSSEVRQVDSGKAIKTNIVLNSTPTLSGKQAEQGLLGVKSTVESIVPAGTPEDTLSLSVISSVVEPIDSVRSRKVTVTSSGPTTLSGGQKKDGLLGETNVSETIVAAGTQPDALTQSVVSSVVEPIDSAKSRKTTITSTGPTSLTESSQDGKLLGNITSTESIVSPDTPPDSPSSTILSSQVKQLDSGKAVKTNVVLNGTPTLIGGQSGEGLLGTRLTTETIVNSGGLPDPLSLNVISSQVEPIDSVRSRKVTVTSSGPSSLSGKQKKEGLLGETLIQESIVAAGSDPDELNTSVISSEVIAIDSAKSRKTTIKSTGPKSLTTKSNDGKLLGNIEVTESVVAPSSNPDSLSGVTAGVLQSEVKQVDNGKAIKQTTRLLSTPKFSGQTKESGLLGEKTTTETIVAAGSSADNLSQSVLSSTVEQIDTQRSKKTTVTSTGPTSLIGKKINERGDVEVITESIVSSEQGPDGDSFLQSSSEVVPIDSSKSRKTTSVVSEYTQLGLKENGAGLLGKTVTTEDIVPASTNPDALSNTVLSSSVQKISKTKAVRKTTTTTGPASLSGVENKGGLLGQTKVTESIVSANSPADAVSLDILSSVVEPIDDAKSKKTTITSSGPTSLTGKNNKSGLLGTTVITESIVPAGSEPDNLSISVLESQVDPIDSAKSKKTTVVSVGPTSLTSKILADTPTGQTVAIKTNSIVDPNEFPVNDYFTLKYDVNAIDSSKSEAEVIKVNSWPTVFGSEYDEITGIPINYSESVVQPSQIELNTGNYSYKPIDEYKGVFRQYNTENIKSFYLRQYYVIETQIQVSLPNKLLDIIAYTSSDYGQGGSGSQARSTGGESYSYSIDSGFKSSAAVNADIYFKLENGFSGYIKGERHIFFLSTENGIIRETILSALNNKNPGQNYKNWPFFKKTTENIVVFTGSKSRSNSGGESVSVSLNGFANAKSGSYSYDVNRNVKTITLPDALHGEITINMIETGPQLPEELSMNVEVMPAKLEATNPQKFPAGKYLISSSMELYKWGLVKVTAETVDITEDYT